jgi:7-carboxy-7-deazaguanine synthase
MFVRLTGCNLSCSWCDTPYTWDWTRHDRHAESHKMTVADVLHRIGEAGGLHTNLLVITGGEPLAQRAGWLRLAQHARAEGWDVEVETNGTLVPETVPDGVALNVSPKLAHSGDPLAKRIRLDRLAKLAEWPSTRYKFVVRSARDIDEACDLLDRLAIPRSRAWLMPEGTHPETVLERTRFLADLVLEAGCQFSTRLHVLTWGDTRAR